MSNWDNKFKKKGFTFDDVLLIPAESHVLPNDADLSTKLGKNLNLKTPILSAGMDTVTESNMAIAMARQGGMGIVHKNKSIIQQAEEVQKVKRSESGVITNPFFLTADRLVSEADKLMGQYRISGVPIVDSPETMKLVGVITNRDLRFIGDFNVAISTVMTSEKLVTAPAGTSLEEAEVILQKNRIEKLPLVDADGKLSGLITIKDIENVLQYPNAAKDENGRLLVGAAVGVTSDTFDRANALIEAGVDAIVVDTAHVHSAGVLRKISEIRAKFPDVTLIAGTDETPGEFEIFHGRRFKTYRGMGSLSAMSHSSADRYFQDGKNEANKLVPEGIEGRVAYKGTLADTIFQQVGGIRSGMGYVGAANLEELRENAQFVEITGAGLVESHPHDVQITKEAPNYSIEN